MVRHPSRNHVWRPHNLSHNTTSISNAASICPIYIWNIKHAANSEHIWKIKQELVKHNNKRKNMYQNNHQDKVGEKSSQA